MPTHAENRQVLSAFEKFKLISPLLQEDVDKAKLITIRQKIAEENDLSVRTLYRYEKAYREHGFDGLKPKEISREPSKKLPANFKELVQEAIQLRKEVPERSVAQIIFILEAENLVAPGLLKRSTLQRHLSKAGFGSRQMKTVKEARESSSKRFCKPHRMMLVQGDIKYGPKLPIGQNGKKIQTYLSSALDDHSRVALQSQFYPCQEESIIEDTFHKAITNYGKFDACYFDNGTQYIAKQIRFSLSRLGIRILHAPPRSGKSKGKVEKFHQVVDVFLRECKLKKIKTLEELNRLWSVFLDEYYHRKAHEGIAEYYESLNVQVPENGISPLQEFNRDSRPLTFIDISVVSEAFLHHEFRKVDKGACISFQGKKYETKPSLIGCEVEISYDPNFLETITVSYPGTEPFVSKPVKIGEFCDRTPAVPVHMENPPTTSRMLDALEGKHAKSKERLANAISFSAFKKEGKENV